MKIILFSNFGDFQNVCLPYVCVKDTYWMFTLQIFISRRLTAAVRLYASSGDIFQDRNHVAKKRNRQLFGFWNRKTANAKYGGWFSTRETRNDAVRRVWCRSRNYRYPQTNAAKTLPALIDGWQRQTGRHGSPRLSESLCIASSKKRIVPRPAPCRELQRLCHVPYGWWQTRFMR